MASEEALISLDDLAKRTGDLKTMPQVARKIIELVSDENSTAQQLSEIIEKDASMTARILKIANSAFYGLRREVKTIQQAVVILGYRSLRSMVVASSSKALHKRFGITEQLMWDQSVGAALTGKLVAKQLPQVVGELAFVGGLLHNVGQTVMNNECPVHYSDVMQLVYNDGLSPIEAELEIFKYSHPEVGFKVTEKWGLPSELSIIIRRYPLTRLKPEERTQFENYSDLKKALACVELATQICRKQGIGYRAKQEDIDLRTLEGAKILQANDDQLNEWTEAAIETFKKERSVFE